MSARAVRLTDVDIDNALAKSHLETVFQPIYALPDRTLLRHEAFVRWDHPGLGNLPPGAFISFFESQGRIGDLTRYVLRQAISQIKSAAELTSSALSINLSMTDLRDEELAGDILTILAEGGFPAAQLMLECPAFTPDVHIDEQLRHYGRLKDIGCDLAVEVRSRATDILRELTPFPFSEIKTGGASVLRQARQGRGGPGMAALADLIAFANEREASVIAIGVENENAVHALEAIGIQAAQGNALGRAAPLNDVARPEGPLQHQENPKSTEPLPTSPSADAPTDEISLATSDADHIEDAAQKARAARVTAAKQAALRKFRASRAATKRQQEEKEAKELAAAERTAAARATKTARELQERLEVSFGEGAAADLIRTETERLAEVEKGVAVTGGFSNGLRMDGYHGTPEADTSPAEQQPKAGALADEAIEETSNSLNEEPEPTSIGAIIAALPDEVIERRPLTKPSASTTATRQANDELDEVVASSPQLPNDPFEETLQPDRACSTNGELTEEETQVSKNRVLIMPTFLRRKYRITHFWPRSWKRAWRRYQAAKAGQHAAAVDDTLLAGE